MKPVFLVGFMGSGKSTLGYAVSRNLNLQYIDLDIYIENRFRTSIKDLFNSRGETAFRIIEQNMLHEVAEFENVIISCGGGTPLYADNMDYMKNQGTTVWL
ncbi:MAG: shikimate kinase, partial [Muribaculaceae bacterium]|nr:shikimate kinase [Muribaculaceae bacterium]